jgi:hypothetical protein
LVWLNRNGGRVFNRLAAIFAAPLGAAAYLAILAINHLGNLDQAFAGEWRIFTRLPWDSAAAYLDRLVHGAALDYENFNALIVILSIIFCILVTIKLPRYYALYAWPTLGILLLRYHDGPQFESMSRYALALFPCFIVGAMLVGRHWTRWLYFVGAGGLQLFLLDRFLHWVWVA